MWPNGERRRAWTVADRSGCLVVHLTSSFLTGRCHLIPNSFSIWYHVLVQHFSCVTLDATSWLLLLINCWCWLYVDDDWFTHNIMSCNGIIAPPSYILGRGLLLITMSVCPSVSDRQTDRQTSLSIRAPVPIYRMEVQWWQTDCLSPSVFSLLSTIVQAQLPSSFRQPHSVHCPPGSPHPAHITSSQSSPSLSPSVSTFHSRLKTHLFHKSFSP